MALKVLPQAGGARHSTVNIGRRETIVEELESGSSDEEGSAATPLASTPRKAFGLPPPPTSIGKTLPPMALSPNPSRGLSLPANVPKPTLGNLPPLS